jgi:hypothetical protein
MEREKRPRRSAAMKLAAVEPGGEEFHLDQVKQMERATLLRNFSMFDRENSAYHCRFLNCTKTFSQSEFMSLSGHLLTHVRESTEKSRKNPKFYENLIFHSVPKDQQDDTTANSKSNKEKLEKTIFRQSPIEGEIPYLLKILNLTRRKPSNDPPETHSEDGIPEKEAKVQVSKIDQIQYDCDTYREWKEGFQISENLSSASGHH